MWDLNRALVSLIGAYRNTYLFDHGRTAASRGKRIFCDDAIALFSHFGLIHGIHQEFDTPGRFNTPSGGRIELLQL